MRCGRDGNPHGNGGGGGGRGKGQWGPPSWSGQRQGNVDSPQNDFAADAVQSENPTLVPEETNPEEGNVSNPQDSLASAVQTDNQSPPIEAASQREKQAGDHTPPWIQSEESPSWCEAMDPRAWGILFSIAILAVALIPADFFGLSRNPTPKNTGNAEVS